MDKYKHTCPKCGQRIEYTIDYCGHQIACPSCHTGIVFPDAPAPTATQKLRLQRDAGPARKKTWRDLALIKALLGFSQWKVVGACLVPFVLVGGLLFGASLLRKSSADEPTAIPRAVAIPVGSDAWKKMTDLGQVEQAVQYRLQAVIAAKRTLLQAQSQATALHDQYHGMTLGSGTYAMVMKQMDDLQKRVSVAQNQVNAEENAFRTSYELYQKLGGKVDYNSQLPQ